MKKFLSAIALAAALVLPSCSSQGLDYTRLLSAGVKATQAATISDEQVQDYVRQYVASLDQQNKVLPASNKYSKRLADPMLDGGGPEGTGTPYFVACWDVSESEDTPFEQRTCSISYPKNNGSGYETFTPLSMMVTNTCFAYYTMTQGNAYAKKFEEGDHLILQAHGIAPDGREKVLEYYLANCNSAIPSQDWISNTWQRFDLSALGEVTGIYFTMKSTDTGSWGMNTPGYFAFDNFEILAVFD